MKTTRPWLIVVGALLSCCAGWTNAVGLLGATHAMLTHVTGTVTRGATDVAAGNLAAGGQAVALVLAFFVGATLAGVLLRTASETPTRGLAWSLFVEAALLMTAWWSLGRLPPLASALAVATSAGLQNALVTSASGAVVRTTHVTGLVTDLGLLVGRRLRGERGGGARGLLQGVLVVAFAAGAVAGAGAYQWALQTALLAPVAVCVGVGVWAWRRST